MIDKLVLELVEKNVKTDQIVLTVGYDIENLTDDWRRNDYQGEITTDRYGRQIPKHARGTANMGKYTSSTKLITEKTLELFDRIVDKKLLTRRLTVTANRLLTEEEAKTYFAQINASGAISDDELDTVAGGMGCSGSEDEEEVTKVPSSTKFS